MIFDRPGEVLRLAFDSDREASLHVQDSLMKFIHKVDFIDSSCSTFKKVTCHAQFSVKVREGTMLWTKHPDSSKLGKKAYYDVSQNDPPNLRSIDDGFSSQSYNEANLHEAPIVTPRN